MGLKTNGTGPYRMTNLKNGLTHSPSVVNDGATDVPSKDHSKCLNPKNS